MRILRTVIQAAPGVVLWLAVSAGNAKEDVIYTYTGNDFNDIFGTSLTESDFVSASFTFASPLPAGPNFADESGSLLNWTVTDGVNTLSEGDGNYLAGLDLSTDLLGDVSASWNFLAESSPYTSTGPRRIGLRSGQTPASLRICLNFGSHSQIQPGLRVVQTIWERGLLRQRPRPNHPLPRGLACWPGQCCFLRCGGDAHPDLPAAVK